MRVRMKYDVWRIFVTSSPRSYSYHFRFLATMYFFLLESIKKQTQKGHNDVLQMLNIDSATRKAHHRFKNVPFEAKHLNLRVGKQQAKTSWQRWTNPLKMWVTSNSSICLGNISALCRPAHITDKLKNVDWHIWKSSTGGTRVCCFYYTYTSPDSVSSVTSEVLLFLCRSFTQTSYVKLTASPSQLCLCAWDFILHWTERRLFSLPVPSEAHGFFLLQPCEGAYRLNDKGTAPTMVGLPDSENEWNSTRSTWDSNGMTTMWVNGKRRDRKILQHHSDRHSEYHSGSRSRLLWWRLQCKTAVCRRPDRCSPLGQGGLSVWRQLWYAGSLLVNWKNLQDLIYGTVCGLWYPVLHRRAARWLKSNQPLALSLCTRGRLAQLGQKPWYVEEMDWNLSSNCFSSVTKKWRVI